LRFPEFIGLFAIPSLSAGAAFGQMTGQLLSEVARNDKHLAELERLDIPFRLTGVPRTPTSTPAWPRT